MCKYRLDLVGLVFILMATLLIACGAALDLKTRIAIVSSYHREYLWSQETSRGVNAALLEFGYLDSPQQAETFLRDDTVESSRAVIRKLWMDSKHKSHPSELSHTMGRIIRELDEFQPQILLLGDDNAANYIGNYFIDTELPVVFWGINGNPLKYDLLDSLERPGHNVTGIYQAGYIKESVDLLKQLLPGVNSLAVLSDNSPTGRSKVKALERYARRGQLAIDLVATVMTNSFDTWKTRTLELQTQVDAFFISNHHTLKSASGATVDPMSVGAWYLRHIAKLDVSHEKQFVLEGILCAVDDSGFMQAYEAMKIAHRILAKGENPASIAVYAPPRGPFIVNLERAKQLGVWEQIKSSPLIEERVTKALALEMHP